MARSICHKYDGLNFFFLQEICEAARIAGGSDRDANLSPSMKPVGSTSEEFGTRELLWTLVDAYDKLTLHMVIVWPLLCIYINFFPCNIFISGLILKRSISDLYTYLLCYQLRAILASSTVAMS